MNYLELIFLAQMIVREEFSALLWALPHRFQDDEQLSQLIKWL
jgi:hypothetical protein